MEMIRGVKLEEDGLYFILESNSGKFAECFVEYDEELDQFIIRANDYIVGTVFGRKNIV